MKAYPLAFEVSGPVAMWTRPDTGDAPTSYPAPTFSAVKGLFESVLWLQSADVFPTHVEICAPLVFHSYTTNYGGPQRKSSQIAKGDNYQLIATVLINVCYRIYADVRSSEVRPHHNGMTNGAHAYQEIFNRRIERGQTFRTPCLGWQEFVPDYLGPFRPTTKPAEDITMELPSMLHAVFPESRNRRRQPVWRQNVRIEKGVLKYAS